MLNIIYTMSKDLQRMFMGMDERDLLRQPAKLYLEGSLFLLVCLVEKLFLKKKR